MTHYELLDIEVNCDFSTLKKAYYAKAKQCHPDLFSNSPEKTENPPPAAIKSPVSPLTGV